nr:hypothetical protein [Tanacetum cinerariifolium]
EKTIPLNDIISQLPPSIIITTSSPVLPIEDPKDSLIMRNEELSTILEKESDKFIKSIVEDFVPILSEFKDTSGSDSECDLHSYDDFSPINVPKGKFMTLSNPLFDYFTPSDDDDINPLFDEVLEDIKSKASYDESALLVTSLFDANEDECFDPGSDVDEINAFDIHLDFKDSYYDSEGYVLYLERFLSDYTTPNLPPKRWWHLIEVELL